MPTTPERIRAGLQLVTSAAIAQVRRVTAEETTPAAQRAALFAATPLLASAFAEGSAALALDWYDELRDLANAPTPFTPEPVVEVPVDLLTKQVAKATREMWLVEQDIDAAAQQLAKVIDLDAERITREVLGEAATEVALTRIDAIVQKEVAGGFRQTIRENVHRDPDAVGWRRHARPGACRFCLHLASKGAIFKRDTALFAAHTNCHCTASPVFDGQDGPEADVMQYMASKRKRTAAERKRLRDYLANKYPDAPQKPVDLDAWVRDNT